MQVALLVVSTGTLQEQIAFQAKLVAKVYGNSDGEAEAKLAEEVKRSLGVRECGGDVRRLKTEPARMLPTAQDSACYRTDLPIMVLAFRDNHDAAVTIQAGEIFKVVGPAQDDRFVVVVVKGEQFLVFESDLKSRGKPVPNTRNSAAA